MKQHDVLDRLLDGDVPADVDVPDDLSELSTLADVLGTAASEQPAMGQQARAELRTHLIREANLLADQPPGLLQRLQERIRALAERWAYSARAAVAGGTAAAMLSTGGVAVAADNSLPGDLFYDLKLAAEDVTLTFAAEGSSRGARLLGQADTRIGEAEAALDRDLVGVAGEALVLADEHAQSGASAYLEAYLDGADTAHLDELDGWVVTTRRRLALLPALTSGAAQALADLRTTMDRIQQRVEVLSTGACTDCAPGVHDDPTAPPTTATGVEADGTPPVPPGAPVDLTFIPPAEEPFRACPCAVPAPAATPPPAPITEEPTADPPAGAGGGSGEDPDGATAEEPPSPPSDGDGPLGDLPLPTPDTGSLTEPLPDPVQSTVEELIEQLPLDDAPGL